MNRVRHVPQTYGGTQSAPCSGKEPRSRVSILSLKDALG